MGCRSHRVETRYTPYIPEELSAYIVKAYVAMRKHDLGDGTADNQGTQVKTGATTYTTARTLLSILRLSQALARLRFQEDVIKEVRTARLNRICAQASAAGFDHIPSFVAVFAQDVDEAVRLMEASSRSLAERARNTVREDPVDAIYNIIINFMVRCIAVLQSGIRLE
jgi:DNA replication licensing factor MCM7